MTATRKCIDSDTQAMAVPAADGHIQCGNCGQDVTTYQQPLRGGGTITAVTAHAMPIAAADTARYDEEHCSDCFRPLDEHCEACGECDCEAEECMEQTDDEETVA